MGRWPGPVTVDPSEVAEADGWEIPLSFCWSVGEVIVELAITSSPGAGAGVGPGSDCEGGGDSGSGGDLASDCSSVVTGLAESGSELLVAVLPAWAPLLPLSPSSRDLK